MRSLQTLASPTGILFDDFVDRSFGWEPIDEPYREAWVGVFHKPPNWPPWLGVPSLSNTPARLVQSDLFRAALPHLKLAITLSRHVANWLRDNIPVPVKTVSHPTEIDVPRFSESAYLGNPDKHVLQVGYVLRNLRAIYQLPAPAGFQKARIVIRSPSADRYDAQLLDYWKRRGERDDVGQVIEYERLPNHAYDDVLTKNVVFLELFDASANNTMLECLVRATPIVVNRLPALEEYLGDDYPLFYDDFADAPRLLTHERIVEGHRYLQRIDRNRFSVEHFVKDMRSSLKEVTK
jgi:hypothetical protein